MPLLIEGRLEDANKIRCIHFSACNDLAAYPACPWGNRESSSASIALALCDDQKHGPVLFGLELSAHEHVNFACLDQW
jgi:hypothetical protein